MKENIRNIFKREKSFGTDALSTDDACLLNKENIQNIENNIIEFSLIKKILEQKKESITNNRKREILESMRNHPSYKGEA